MRCVVGSVTFLIGYIHRRPSKQDPNSALDLTYHQQEGGGNAAPDPLGIQSTSRASPKRSLCEVATSASECTYSAADHDAPVSATCTVQPNVEYVIYYRHSYSPRQKHSRSSMITMIEGSLGLQYKTVVLGVSSVLIGRHLPARRSSLPFR
jgi:hypothetical protein